MPTRSPSNPRLRAAVFSPLSEDGKARQVEDRLLQGIVAGILADGDRLPRESELAASFGVSTVTAREALVGLRSLGLVRTQRGREGGSFVTVTEQDRSQLVRDRLAGMTRVALRDLAIHYAAIASSAAELATRYADGDDVRLLREILGEPGASWLRASGSFLMELAALSQSARLTREFVELHAEFGLLLHCVGDDAGLGAEALRQGGLVADAVAQGDADAARHRTAGLLEELLRRLIREQRALLR
ncbi:GntR family transcriptional regulator [Zhihengliuella sp.]|uniref:FadR/GntR family transcriptional regulator n=1 Tax=Zhihengliuella sp. TaxID=1954483 RepID=UPI00281253FB|nr:GntR family transcriptional regulator [Zhihengliuella sp.]